jgi:hypothetical protein
MFLNARFRSRLVLALALGSAITTYAGGFWISIQNPTTVKDAVAKNAVVLVRLDGCHNHADATVTATAEGLVNGQRRSIPLKLEPVSQPATYAVAPQWPAEGKWILNFSATYLGRDAGIIVRLTPGKFEKQSTKMFLGKIAPEALEASLRASAE